MYRDTWGNGCGMGAFGGKTDKNSRIDGEIAFICEFLSLYK